MHRLERQHDVARACVRQHGGKPFAKQPARARQIARTRREAAADDDDCFGADGGGFIDHPLVVVDRVPEFVAAFGPEQTAPAVAGDAHAVRAKNARAFGNTDLLHHLAPRRDAG